MKKLFLFAVVVWSLSPLYAGTDSNGFINEYLVLGPYDNPGGTAPGGSVLREDFSDDGTTNEDNIVPVVGNTLGLPLMGFYNSCGGRTTSCGLPAPDPTLPLFPTMTTQVTTSRSSSPGDPDVLASRSDHVVPRAPVRVMRYKPAVSRRESRDAESALFVSAHR